MAEKQKILIVDDNEDNLFVLKMILQDVDVEVVCSSNGKDALLETKKHDFALAIIDVVMPQMDGFELAGRLCDEVETSSIPIIFLSAVRIHEQDICRGFEFGLVDYITKPYAGEVLLGKVRVLLELDRQRKELDTYHNRLKKLVAERTEALTRVAQEWKTTFDATHDAISILDEKQCILRCNKAEEKLFNRPFSKLIGKKCCEVVHGTDDPVEGCPVVRAKKSLRREKMELQLGDRWFQVTADPILDDQGRYNGAVHIVTDITERVRMKQQLEKLNHMNEELIGSGSLDEKMKIITDGVVDILDADFARIWIIRQGDRCESGCMHAKLIDGPQVCRERERCLHLAASSGRYTHIDGKTHCRVPFGCYMIGLVAVGEDEGFYTNQVTTDERVHDLKWAKKLGLASFAGHKLVGTKGEPAGVLALFSQKKLSGADRAVLRSVADTASNLIQVSRVTEALEDSERYYRSILHNIREDIVIIDPEYRIVDINNMALASTGYLREEVVGRRCFEILHGYNAPCNQMGERCLLHEVLKVGECRTCEHLHVRKDGSKIQVGILLSPLKDSEGNITHVIQAIRDISERKATEEELAKYRENLEELVEDKTRDLRKTVNLMAGREIRMAELKKQITLLRKQLADAGMVPVVSDYSVAEFEMDRIEKKE